MDKKSNNPEQLKKYTRELRDLIDSYKVLSVNEISKLKKKYSLSEEDETQLSTIIDRKINEANRHYEYGEWQKAVEAIEEANYKDPFNKEVIILYYNICKEKSAILGSSADDQQIMNLLLKRLSMVDKNLYKKIVKTKNEKSSRSKISKMWFLLLLLLIIPIVIILPGKGQPDTRELLNDPTNFQHNGKREITVSYKGLNHPSAIKLVVKKSILEGFKNNFFYTLLFQLSSSEQNITRIEGKLLWYNYENSLIFEEEFSTQNGIEYYLNEVIPFSYFKTSQRVSPDLDSVHIEITKIESNPGKKRENTKPVECLVSGIKSHKISIEEAGYQITEGVSSRYLSLILILHNTGNKPLVELKGDIEWVDNYDLTTIYKKINLIKKMDMPLEPGDKRTVYKVLELDDDITDSYRINLEGPL